jgi:hypothetical protein
MRNPGTTRTRLAAGLLVLLMTGCAKGGPPKGEPPVVRITGKDPEAPATLPLEGRVYLRVAYEAKSPLKFHAVGYRGGVRVPGTTNPGPPYGPGAGDSIVYLAYPKEQEIDEVRVIVSDERWRPWTEISVPLALRWTPTAPAHTWSEWARRLVEENDARTLAMMKKQ